MEQIAYIADDLNCIELLQNAGLSACPSIAVPKLFGIENILRLSQSGGNGVVREFIDII